MRIATIGLLLIIASMLAGCFTMYRVDIPQGNIVTPTMVAMLKPGMTRRQVRFVLGTPLVMDPFHPDRWDYFYSLSKDGGPAVQHHMALFFSNDTLLSASGDLAPANLKAAVPTNPPDSSGRSS